jgi:hypothetical protein
VGTYSWIVCSLAAFDVVVVALAFLLLRSHPFLDRKGRVVTVIALSGFGFHAVVFFHIVLALCPSKRQSTDSARSRTYHRANLHNPPGSSR